MMLIITCARGVRENLIKLMRSGGGLIALRSQRNVKMEVLRFYSKYYIPDAKIYPVMMWIQIHAGGAEFFFIKTVHYGAFLVFPNTLLSTILSRIYHDSKNNLLYQSSIQSRLAC